MPLLTSLLVAASMSSTQSKVVSPEVHPDKTVTFRFKGAKAEAVSLYLEGQGNQKMDKSADGVWSITTKPLAPDYYGYSFVVDGNTTIDPLNSRVTPNLFYAGNQVLVAGNPPELWEIQDVPRGNVTRHYYKSAYVGDYRDFLVYTPPGYSAKSSNLPVLYLLHGYSDTTIAWTEVGKAHVILDNLLAQNKIKPMVVVMPLGYGIKDFANPNVPATIYGLNNFPRFKEALLTEVMPQVESNYKVSKKKADRAICGLSMGGAESLFVGLNHLDKFNYIGAFSSGGFPTPNPEDSIKGLSADKAKELKILWMVCGRQDNLIGFQRGFSDWLKKKGMNVETKETEGGHVWQLWRRNLAEFTQRLFK